MSQVKSGINVTALCNTARAIPAIIRPMRFVEYAAGTIAKTPRIAPIVAVLNTGIVLPFAAAR